MPAVDYPLFKAEDVDGFFALFQNNLLILQSYQ